MEVYILRELLLSLQPCGYSVMVRCSEPITDDPAQSEVVGIVLAWGIPEEASQENVENEKDSGQDEEDLC